MTVKELVELIKTLADFLKEIEWEIDPTYAYDKNICYSCSGDGLRHEDDCPLTKALKQATEVVEAYGTPKWHLEEIRRLEGRVAQLQGLLDDTRMQVDIAQQALKEPRA
jgi:hypothetical protein